MFDNVLILNLNFTKDSNNKKITIKEKEKILNFALKILCSFFLTLHDIKIQYYFKI